MTPEEANTKFRALPHLMAVNPDDGFGHALLNAHNGMLLQRVKQGGALMGISLGGGRKGFEPGSWVLTALPAHLKADETAKKEADFGTNTHRFLDADDLDRLHRTWAGQAKLLGL